MNQPAGSPNQQDDSIAQPLILGGLLMGTLYILWLVGDDQIRGILFILVGAKSQVVQHVPFLYPEYMSQHFENWAVMLPQANPSNFDGRTAWNLANVLFWPFVYIVVPIVLWRVWAIQKYGRIRKFCRDMDLRKLAELNAPYTPAVHPILDEKLIDQPLHEGPWAMARIPIDWALLNETIYSTPSNDRNAGEISRMLAVKRRGGQKRRYVKGWKEKQCGWSLQQRRKKMPPPWQCHIDRDRCDQLLEKQLRGPWRGIWKCTPFERCAFAVISDMIIHGNERARETALHLAKSFKRCDSKGRHQPVIDVKYANQIADKNIKDWRIQEVVRAHHFKMTVFMGFMDRAQKNGVFISSEMLWLKPVDRALYLALNQLGGDRSWAEAAGPWCHYYVEKKYGGAVRVPCVEGGTDGIEKNLFEEEWIADSDGWLKSEIEAEAARQAAMKQGGENAGDGQNAQFQSMTRS